MNQSLRSFFARQLLIAVLLMISFPALGYSAGKFDYFEVPTGKDKLIAEKAIRYAALKWVAEKAKDRELILVRFSKYTAADQKLFLERLGKDFPAVKFQIYSEKAWKQLTEKAKASKLPYPSLISPPYEVEWKTKDTVKVGVNWILGPGDLLSWELRIRMIDNEWKVSAVLSEGMSMMDTSKSVITDFADATADGAQNIA